MKRIIVVKVDRQNFVELVDPNTGQLISSWKMKPEFNVLQQALDRLRQIGLEPIFSYPTDGLEIPELWHAVAVNDLSN